MRISLMENNLADLLRSSPPFGISTPQVRLIQQLTGGAEGTSCARSLSGSVCLKRCGGQSRDDLQTIAGPSLWLAIRSAGRPPSLVLIGNYHTVAPADAIDLPGKFPSR